MLKRLFPALAVVALLAGSPAQAAPYDSLYIFGDSLSDAGNNALVIGANSSQVITDNTYIPLQPYGSGQYTNGNVWATTFANSLGLGAYAAPALAGGGNFAFGGARTSQDGDPPFNFPPSLKSQASSFLSLTGGVAPGSALYVVAGGGNDARDTLTAAGAAVAANDLVLANSIIGAAAMQYAADTEWIVHSLRSAGARSIVVWNTPNLGLVPAVTANGPGASFLGSLVASSMNAALGAAMADETGVTIFDDYGLLTAAVANPAAFGLTNATDACGNLLAGCDPATSMFWDGIHPTAAGHALLAHEMLRSASVVAVPEPETYAMMLAGLGLLGLVARRRKQQAA
ncbi:MAG: SGNH/GDSL hydrolase family protein [Rhodocyclales bacterium]|nr:SGNH/GDSL hydrolase family protein [Rhodocyclales bacterium]